MNLLGARKADADRIEMLVLADLVEEIVARRFHLSHRVTVLVSRRGIPQILSGVAAPI